MAKKPPSGPPRRRHLTREDEALWAYTAASLQPLPIRKGRHVSGAENLDGVPPFETKTGKKAATSPAPAKPQDPPLPVPPRAGTGNASAATPALNTFDRKAARKLRQGRFEIEARIDLHGMRQQEAHAALRRFLHASFRRGLRWVLVITGKGGARHRRDEEVYGFGTPEPGVLKRNVPQWLTDPDMRAIVVSYTTAAVSHGGEGALYIQLRNPERART